MTGTKGERLGARCMRRNRSQCFAAVLALLMGVPGLAPAQPSSAPSGQAAPQVADRASDVTETAKTLKLGEEAYESGRFQQSYEYFLKAWARKKTYDVASFLGACELRLNLFRDAAEHLAYALRLLPPTTPLGPEKLIRDKLASARLNVGTVRIKTNVPTATLKIDGRATDQPPTQDELYVDPGQRTFELSAHGYESAKRMIDVARGDTRELTIDLTAIRTPVALPLHKAGATEGSAAGAAGEATSGRSEAPAHPSYVPAFVAGGATILAGGAGLVFLLLSMRADDDAGVRRTAILAWDGSSRENPCDEPGATVSVGCANLRSVLDDRDKFHNLAVGSFIGAGAAALATGYFLLRPPKASVGALPMLSPHASGLTVRGEW